MSPAQYAARRAMEHFIEKQGGSRFELSVDMDHEFYYWTAPDGRRAVIGWATRPGLISGHRR